MSVFFVLKQFWEYPDGTTRELMVEIKAGRKTNEWRDASPHWLSRLFTKKAMPSVRHRMLRHEGDLMFIHPDDYKYKKARFRVGYKMGPTLEADITRIWYHTDTDQFEFQFTNVVEVIA